MRILLDTHVFLWAITDDPKLPVGYRDLYRDESTDLYLSLASVWEMLIKCTLGKLQLPTPAASYLTRQLEENRVNLLPLRTAHFAELGSLPPLHRDPFDRMLVAQARAEKMSLLSVDAGLRRYDVAIL